MPTTRTRRTRGRIGGGDIISWIRWHCTILQFIPRTIGTGSQSPWVGKDSLAFWKEHRDAIMATYLEQNRERNRPFQRPRQYWGELAQKSPRLKIGTHEWWGAKSSPEPPVLHVSDVYENNYQYLKRLGLLEAWEMEAKNANK